MYTRIHNTLLELARKRHGEDIVLCSPSITEFNGYILLWYNDNSGSTHVVKLKLIGD